MNQDFPETELCAGKHFCGSKSGKVTCTVRGSILVQAVCNKTGSDKKQVVICRMLGGIADADKANGLSASGNRNSDQTGDILTVKKLQFKRRTGENIIWRFNDNGFSESEITDPAVNDTGGKRLWQLSGKHSVISIPAGTAVPVCIIADRRINISMVGAVKPGNRGEQILQGSLCFTFSCKYMCACA